MKLLAGSRVEDHSRSRKRLRQRDQPQNTVNELTATYRTLVTPTGVDKWNRLIDECFIFTCTQKQPQVRKKTKGLLKPNSITLAGSKLVADRFEARRPASSLSATSFEPASVMEFGF